MKIFGRGRSSTTPKKTIDRRPVYKSFQSVTIETSSESCAAVRAAAGRKYLCSQAPILPLADCDNPGRCACRYERYDDRRDGPRRRAEGALPSSHQPAALSEQRSDQGRRADELGSSGTPMPWFKNI
jgi:hypothetical protein